MIKIGFFIFCFLSLMVAIFFIFQPESAIKLQQKFYAKINWKIEPISYSKEVRNTRIMGIIVLFLILLTTFFLCKK